MKECNDMLGSHKLSANENPFGASHLVYETLQKFQSPHHYPDATAKALKLAICENVYQHEDLQLDPNRILCGCGSEDLLYTTISTLVGTGDDILLPTHGFCIFQIAAHNSKAQIISIPYNKNMQLTAKNVLSIITPNTKVICIDHPGNPIGTYMSAKDLQTIITSVESHITIIIDAAYCDYLKHVDDYDNGLHYALSQDNVIVTRTFSKAYGLAGLRLGWLYTSEKLISKLTQKRVLYKTTSIAQSAGIAALMDPDFINRTITHNQNWLNNMHVFLQEKNLLAFQTYANFIVCDLKTKDKAERFIEHLKSHHISVMSLSSYELTHLVRISIGNDESMNHLVAAINVFCESV